MPQSDRKSFFKFLATDIKGNRNAIRAEDAANSIFQEPNLGISREKISPCAGCQQSAGCSLGHSTDDYTDCSCDELLIRAENWKVRFRALSDDDIPLRARLFDQQSNTSTAVNARVEWRNGTKRHFVIRTGTRELQAFPLSVMKIARIWGGNPLERIVEITLPYCDSDGFHAVYLKLDSCDCLERLSHMTGLDIV